MFRNEKIIKAIKKINPVAEVTVYNGDLDNLVWTEGTAPISKSDIEAQILVVEQEILDEATKKETDKTSGKQKLKDLGLNDDEIKELTGA